MRGSRSAVLAVLLLVPACEREAPRPPGPSLIGAAGGAGAAERAGRRAYDGAPPVIPHPGFGVPCGSCHRSGGAPDGAPAIAPPSPHEGTEGIGATGRCLQCHVHRQTEELFCESGFQGLRQDLRAGNRLHDWAPPVIPHQVLLREDCAACHAGPWAREEVRTHHPERLRCRQCHLESTGGGEFIR